MITLKGETGYIIAAQLRKIPILSNEEVYQLISEAKSGNIESLNKLLHHSLRIVAYCISVHFSWALKDVDTFMDLFQQGSIYLRTAILRYDESKASYVTFCHRQVWGMLLNYIKLRRDRGNKDGSSIFVPLEDVVLSTYEDYLTKMERRQKVERILALPLLPNERDLFLHILKGYNQNEWAKLKGFSRQRAGQIYHKLLKKIEKLRDK